MSNNKSISGPELVVAAILIALIFAIYSGVQWATQSDLGAMAPFNRYTVDSSYTDSDGYYRADTDYYVSFRHPQGGAVTLETDAHTFNSLEPGRPYHVVSSGLIWKSLYHVCEDLEHR